MEKLSRKEVFSKINKIVALAGKIREYSSTGIIVHPGFENEILGYNNPELSFWYAYYIPGADIEKHQKVVLDSKQPSWCYKFACYIPGADIISLTNVVMESKDPYYSYLCARDIPQIIPDFDITPFEDSVLELEDSKWSSQFLHNVKGSRKELHENVIRNNEAKKLSKRISRTISRFKKSS